MDLIITIFSLIVLLFSVIIHELAHGYVAHSLGDPTAKYAGRLTLNPLKHLDLFGSVVLPGLMLLLSGGRGPVLGWAKPVPFNPYNFKDQKWGAFKVAIAGPTTNIVLALIFGLLIRFIPIEVFVALPGILIVFSFIVYININLAIFNLMPIPPLDGSWVLFHFISDRFNGIKTFLEQYGIFILLIFIFFGLPALSFVDDYLLHLITGL